MNESGSVERLNAALEARYRIEGKLGEGGMATVFLAHDLRHDRNVALKVLKPELAAVVGGERFLAEIRTTAKLQHPHILPLHDSGDADGFLYYVMPYVEGESLRELLDRERQLPVDEAVRIAVNVAEALDYAHRQGVVHRDIKPANILMLDGKPVVADFGIALAVGAAGGGRITETGLSLGTPHYMSPEQATGDRSVGPASDIYALGCVLYESLIGEPPFTGSTPQAVLGRIITGDTRPASESRPTVPPHVESSIAKAIEKIPADRFASAHDFGAALRDPGFRWPPETGTRRGPEREGRRWDRRSLAVGAVAGILAGILGGMLLPVSRQGDSDRVVHSSLVPPRGAALPMSVQPFAISDDGARIVYRVAEDGGIELRTRLLSEDEAVPIAGTDGAESLFLSPDGGWVVFHNPAEGELRRVRVTGGPVERVASLREGADGAEFHGGVWGPDDSIVFATATGLSRVPASGGRVTPLTTVDPAAPVRHRQPVLLPDGRSILYTVTAGGYPPANDLTVLDPEGGGRAVMEGHSARVLDDGTMVFARGDAGELWATRLRGETWEALDEPVRVLDGVGVNQGFSHLAARYALAADGTLLYYPAGYRGGSWDIVRVQRDGTMEPIVDPSAPGLPPGGRGVHGVRLSPDGSRLAFSLVFDDAPDYRIFVYDLRRRTLNPVNVDQNADWSVWTPDGQEIVFNRFSGENQDLFVARPDNVRPPEPLIPPNAPVHFAQSFSPDGDLLLVQERASPNDPDRDLRIVSLEDGSTTPLVATPAPEYLGSVSPDGRWVAYTSEESGQPAVYVTEFPESRNRVRVSVQSAFDPVWSPTEDRLFYRRSGDGAVMAVPYSTEGGFTPGEAEEVVTGSFRDCCTNGRSYDVSPDGQSFVMMRQFTPESGVPRLELVQNWLGPVRERLGR